MKDIYYVECGALWRFDGMVHIRIAIFEPDVSQQLQERIAKLLADAAVSMNI